jgi:hypothetical protein
MTDKATLTIEEFSTLLATKPETTPEISAFGQLRTIETPATVGEALIPASAWGWH